jgi:hypothetical protein
VSAPLAVLRVALAFTGAYVLWLVVFERWAEPAMRRWAGAIFHGPIDWRRAFGPFRTWSLRGAASRSRRAGVGVVFNVVVAGSAFVPPVLLGWLFNGGGDESIAASVYLMTPAMTALFAARVLWHRPGA